MRSSHHQTAFSIVTSHGNVLQDDESLDGLIDDIASALKNAFDSGFAAGQRREATGIGWMGDIGGNPYGPSDQ